MVGKTYLNQRNELILNLCWAVLGVEKITAHQAYFRPNYDFVVDQQVGISANL